MEIRADAVSKGASIQFLSQYPGEEEIITPPLACLEVPHENREDGSAWG